MEVLAPTERTEDGITPESLDIFETAPDRLPQGIHRSVGILPAFDLLLGGQAPRSSADQRDAERQFAGHVVKLNGVVGPEFPAFHHRGGCLDRPTRVPLHRGKSLVMVAERFPIRDDLGCLIERRTLVTDRLPERSDGIGVPPQGGQGIAEFVQGRAQFAQAVKIGGVVEAPSRSSRMFEGLTSRWTTPRECA